MSVQTFTNDVAPSWISSGISFIWPCRFIASMDPSQEKTIFIRILISHINGSSRSQAERMRMHILGRVPANFDIQIFEHLPLFIQAEVIKGEVLYVVDEDELYDIALKIFREYEFFRPHYLDYIGEREIL